MIAYILLLIGLAMLLKGADVFVDAASGIAKRLGMSQLLIGLTVVAMGTSAPELFVSVSAALQGHTDLALGNIIGSNISNLLLIGGIGALCGGIQLDRSFLQSFYVSLFLALLLRFTSFEGTHGSQGIGIVGGSVLIIARGIYLAHLINTQKKQPDKTSDTSTTRPWWILIFLATLGLLGLCYGSTLVIQNALKIGTMIGISERIMGLVVVAVGTSLPELVTTAVAVRKGFCSLGLGNIIGSNIFNIGLIGGLTAVIHPIAFDGASNIDVLFLVLITFAFIIAMQPLQSHNITKFQGGILIIVYCLYIVYSIIIN